MNRLRLNPLDWPITMKVPLLVVCLMLAVSTVLSERVLDRLTEMQENELKSLASTYLNSLASSLQPHVLREDVWEVYDTLDRMRSDAAGFRPLRSVVVNPGLVVLASSDPRWAPVKSKLPEDLLSVSESRTDLLIDPIANRAFAQREISYQDRKIGTVFAEIDIAPLLIERTNVFQTLLLTNALLTLAFAMVGYLAVRRMLRPVKVLTEHIDRGRQGSVEQIPDQHITREGSEFARLFHRYNALAAAVNEREAFAAKLAEEEKLASLGRLASGMAHEINNPLGGMFTALDTLKRHGGTPSVRGTSLRLIEQGLRGIRDVVRATLVTYRRDQSKRLLQPVDIDDLRLLTLPEARRKSLMMEWLNELPNEVAIPAGEVRQIVLNLILNAMAATDANGQVKFIASLEESQLVLQVIDTGTGMPPELVSFLTEQESRAPIQDEGGLGLWMVRRLVRALNGSIQVHSTPEGGTSIRVALPTTSDGEEVRDVA